MIDKSKTLREIGWLCREKRLEKGISQKEIAHELNCTIENISAFERGRNANLIVLLTYIKTMNIDIDLKSVVIYNDN